MPGVTQVEGYMYSMAQNRMRMRVYHTKDDVHPNHIFMPIVSPPSASHDFKPRVDWENFHQLMPLEPKSARHSAPLERLSRVWGSGERIAVTCLRLLGQ